MIMRRLSTLLRTAIPKPYTLLSLPSLNYQRSLLPFHTYFSFSSTPITLLQRFQNMTDDKELDDLISNLQNQNDVDREVCLNTLMGKVFSNDLPERVVMNERLLQQLSRYPLLHYDGIFLRITQQINALQIFKNEHNEKGMQLVIRDINQCFVKCFEILNSIAKEKAGQIQIDLHRAFAEYHINYLFDIVSANKKKQVIFKGRQFYKSSLNKVTAVLKQMAENLKLIKQKQLKQDYTLDDRQFQIQQMKQVMFDLMQQSSNATFELLKLQHMIDTQLPKQTGTSARAKRGRLQKQKNNSTGFKFNEGAFELHSYFKRATDHYELLDKINLESNLYLKVKKMWLELLYHQKLAEIQKQEIGQAAQDQLKKQISVKFTEDILQLYNEALNIYTNGWKFKGNMNPCLETAAVMLSIKLYSLQGISNDEEGRRHYDQAISDQIKKLSKLAPRKFRKYVNEQLQILARKQIDYKIQENQQQQQDNHQDNQEQTAQQNGQQGQVQNEVPQTTGRQFGRRRR